MSDQTNPPVHPHHPGAAGGPQGPNGPYSAPQDPRFGPQQPGTGAQSNQFGAQGNQGPWQQPAGQPPYQGGGQYQGRPPYQGGPAQQPYPGQPPYQSQTGYQGQHQGQAQYGGPQAGGGQPPYGPGFPAAQQWQPEPRKKRGKLIPLVAVLAVLAVIGGGGLFAYARLNGGGGQPAEVLPGTAVAYARVDLNPSAGQRVAALRYLMKFPSAKERIGLTGENDDLRQKLFELIKTEAGDDLADVDFDKDVKPWLGDRAGLAALPPSGDREKPDVVVAVQVKDEDKATKGLDKLFAKETDKPGRVFTDGYVLLGDNQAIVDAAASTAKDSPLSENAKFDGDMSALGEQGFASFWADTAGLSLLAQDDLTEQQRKAMPAGSMAAAVRFDAQYVELKGVVRSDEKVKTGSTDAGELVSQLPDTTAGAFALSGGAEMVDTMWAQLQKSSSELNLDELTKNFTAEYGLKLPDDLKPLLGRNLAVAMDKDDESGPKIAARMESDPAKAEQVVDKLMNLVRTRSAVRVPVEKAKDEDTLVIATDQAYADQVLKGGNLGQSENFKQAVPDSKGAVMVGFVDFEAAASLSDEISSNKDASALRSAGVTARQTGEGQAEFTLRVVAK
ncbi:hypothetical protein Kfla_2904 [Kribbella flavida DSM 17836]|uniref:DUF3352 domain-containing protein n=1 Tax=Kribbella flavida (strain DSM 17836 / JCM 10339 / NBRC 14399) TaxID=479435 RepID=D2Q0H7_KRIFD|nr:DUF3352 domain-containing protein [Kribbella flavida]ADB31969.1 hypothetical protein Kfla_2904 [Kribbella flavida DSM 17836]